MQWLNIINVKNWKAQEKINLHNAPRTAAQIIFPFVRSQPVCSNHLHQGSLCFNLVINHPPKKNKFVKYKMNLQPVLSTFIRKVVCLFEKASNYVNGKTI